MSDERKIIAVDFDGTLCEDAYPKMGRPNLYLIRMLKEWRAQGQLLILWSCRCGSELEEAVRWCKRLGLEFDAVNQNVLQNIEKYGTDTRKVYADLYLDDKARSPFEYCSQIQRMREGRE